MYTARFLYNIYEEKYAINPYYSWGYSEDGNWYLADEYSNVGYPIGYKTRNVMRYVKIKEQGKILHKEDIEIVLSPLNKLNINNEIVTIVDVVRNLDGSIDYYTDKKEYISLNNKDTYFDERPNQDQIPDKPTPPKGRIVYENITGTEKEYKFWNKVFKKTK